MTSSYSNENKKGQKFWLLGDTFTFHDYGDQKYNQPTFEYEITYQNKELSVIPIKFKDKKPAISSWQQYQKDKPSLEEIKEWFDSNNNNNKTNIAIVTGKVSKIIAFDIDGKATAPIISPWILLILTLSSLSFSVIVTHSKDGCWKEGA